MPWATAGEGIAARDVTQAGGSGSLSGELVCVVPDRGDPAAERCTAGTAYHHLLYTEASRHVPRRKRIAVNSARPAQSAAVPSQTPLSPQPRTMAKR